VARLHRWLSGGKLRELAQSCLPLVLLKTGWTLANRLTFDALSAKETLVVFGPGDLLVMADECWNYKAWQAAALARAHGATAVLVLYDLIPLRQPQYCAPLFTRAFRPWLLNMIANCDAIMCISRATALDFQGFCQEQGVAQPPTSHFRLGCDISADGGATGSVRPEVAEFADQSSPWFAVVGTIEARKNHALLLRVFEQLWERGVDVRLFVAGRPHPECARLVNRMLRHPEQGRRLLTLLDATDGEVSLAYSRCRALLFPSLAEGFGLPLVEARARGCIVIASALPALLELRDDGVHFFKTDSAVELEALILEQARAAGRLQPQPASTFTWRESATELIAQVRRLANAPVGMADDTAVVRN
jgi:alpha-1,2-rhamnosyltransferase